MDAKLAKIGMLGCTERIMDELKAMILSVQEVNKSLKEIENLVENLSLEEVVKNIDSLAKVASLKTNVKYDPKEMEIMSKMMECNISLAAIYMTEEIPTIREMSRILAQIHLVVDEYEECFGGREGTVMPSNEFYKILFALINTRILVQK